MSLSTLPTILDRIDTAPIGSPIAVYAKTITGDHDAALLDAVFADTIGNHLRLLQPNNGLIGTYSKKQDRDQVRHELLLALGR